MFNAKDAPTDRWDANLHGWDAQAGFWHGPTPLTRDVRGTRATAAKINSASGVFCGRLRCSVPGLPSLDFHTTIYDLTDAALAIVHLDGAYHGPVGVVAVIPAPRRRRLRTEFAFEFVSLLTLLNAHPRTGSELTIHDYIEDVLRTAPLSTQIFAVETAECSPDIGIVLSTHFEHLSGAMVEWLNMKDSAEDEEALEFGAAEASGIGRPQTAAAL